MSLQVEGPPGEVGGRRFRNKMGVKRKRVSPPESQQGGGGGLYVHSSPPRVMQMNPNIIRQWLRTGDLDKLETVVLEGQGHKLVGEYSPDPKVRAYLKTLPAYLAKMEMAHEAVNKGRLEDLKTLLAEDKRGRLALCKDSAGVPLLHKAVFLGHEGIMSWLVENHPETATLKDKEGRTPLHYVGALSDPSKGWELIEPAGADPACTDAQGHTASYYMDHPEEIHLPESRRAGNSSNFRRFTSGKDGLVVTRANIRIWIHDRDLGRLQQMLWQGHGGKLRVETSNNPRVKRFLDAVPYIMGTIKDTHAAVIHDDLELYQKRTADPVPSNILVSKDQNGLNPLHKAAGLGREEMVQDILQRHEGALSLTDNEGRTPLHYAAALRDGGHMYNLLVEAGADENAVDSKGKVPNHYRHKPGELDTKLLRVIPDAPRTATRFPPAWDWRLLNNMTYDFGPIATDTPSVEGSSARTKIQKTDSSTAVAATATAATAAAATTAVAAAGGLPSRQPTPIPTNKLAEDAPDVVAQVEDEEEDEGMGDEGDHEEDEREDVVMPDVQQHEEEEEEEEEKPEETQEEAEEEPKEEEEAEEQQQEEDEQVDRWEREPSEEDQDSGAGAEPESAEQEQDEEVAQLVEEGNMEQLANLVLDGQGERLIGVTSTDPELQSFLNNVPAYMAKIRTVHEAAKEGRLRDLQAALDRRKFAIAKDSETPLGATPLHLAVLFGHTPIVRYLAGRFPETMSARDTASQRTPLHYAAALDDNGHYYNLLVSLGANTELVDEFGNTAEYYMQNPGLFTKKRLLQKFGVEEGSVPNKNLTDQVENDVVSARREVDQPDILETLERCYEVIHEGTDSSDRLLKTHLRRPVFDSLKMRLTRNDHSLLDVIWPGAKEIPEDPSKEALDEELEDIVYGNGGVLAPDYESYSVFAELLVPIVKDLHGLTAGYDINIQPKTTFFLKNEVEGNARTIGEVKVDPTGKKVTAGVLECTRNLAEYQFPSSLSLAALEMAERDIIALLEHAEQTESDEQEKYYYSVAEVLEENSEIKNKLESEHLLLPIRDDDGEVEGENLLHGPHWPRGRGVFLVRGGGLAVWVNVLEHIRVIASTPSDTPGDIGVAYDRLARFITKLDEQARDKFRYDPVLGYLAVRPSCLGNTLNLMLDIHLPYLARDRVALYKLCSARGLTIRRRKADKENTFLISNQQSLSITEHQTLKNFASAVANIVQLETAGDSTASPLPTGILGIFKK